MGKPFLLLVLVSSLGSALTPAQVLDPALKELQRYVGTWTYEGDGLGSRITCTSVRRWIAGGYYVESHRECATPQGPITQVELFGYNSRREVYVYWGFNGRDVSTYTSPGMG